MNKNNTIIEIKIIENEKKSVRIVTSELDWDKNALIVTVRGTFG